MSDNAFAAQSVASAATSEPGVEVVGAEPEVVVVGAAVEPETEVTAAPEPQPQVEAIAEPEPEIVDEPEPEPVAAVETTQEIITEQPVISGGAYVVQLGSFRVETTARNVWREVKSEPLFSGYTARVVAEDLGGDSGKWHRLQVGPLPSRQAAVALCADYKTVRAQAPCIPVVAEN